MGTDSLPPSPVVEEIEPILPIIDGFTALCGAGEHLPGWSSGPYPTLEQAEAERQKHAAEYPTHDPFVTTAEEAIEIERDWALQDRDKDKHFPPID